jgi:Ca2+-binding RTX toxin-like protein
LTTSRRALCVGFLVSALAAPSGASAATTVIGQVAPESAPTGKQPFVVQESTAGAPSYEVPAGGGVITSWSMRAETDGGTAKLKVFRQTSDVFPYLFHVESESALETVEAGRVNTFTTHIVVTGGEELGLTADGPITFFSMPSGGFDERANFASDPPPGTDASVTSSALASRVNVSANVESDTDGDARGDDTEDNCPGTANAGQENLDGDAQGDACDDDDGDGVARASDNCPGTANPGQENLDGDGQGDACDADDDNDGAADASDNCPRTANADQADFDSDGSGDACGDAPKPGSCANRRTGSAGADVMTGTAFGDNFAGLAGNDSMTGLAQRDCLNGGRGADTIAGGAGRDLLLGGPGGDRLKGGPDKDSLSGGSGNDKLSARDGTRDTLRCGSGGRDRATVDRKDRVSGCEIVRRR